VPEPGSLGEVRSRAVRGAFSVGLRNLVVRSINLLATIALARLLAPRDFGLLAVGLTIKSISEMIATGGLAAGLIRRETPPSRDELRAALGFQLSTTCVAVALIGVAGLLFGTAAWVAFTIALSLPLFALRVPTIVMLERGLDWALPARVEVLETVVYAVAAVALVLAGAGVWGVAAASSLQALVGSVGLIALGPVGVTRPILSSELIRPMLRFGVQFQAVPLVGAGRDQGVNLVVAAVGGVTALGFWSAAYRVLQTILLLLQSLWRVSYPAMSRALETGADIRRTLEQILRVTSVLVGIPVVVVAGSADALVHLVFGPDWAPAAAALPWGAAAIFLHGPISTASSGFLQARGRVTAVLVIVSVQASVWIAAAALLMDRLGAEAVGVGMFAGAVVYWALTVAVLRTEVPVRVVSATAGAAISVAIAALAAHAVAAAVSSPLAALALSAPAGVALYLGVLSAVGRADLRAVWSAIRLARSGARASPLTSDA
jgi:O-antigen/teichoic acid export membrane protein